MQEIEAAHPHRIPSSYETKINWVINYIILSDELDLLVTPAFTVKICEESTQWKLSVGLDTDNPLMPMVCLHIERMDNIRTINEVQVSYTFRVKNNEQRIEGTFLVSLLQRTSPQINFCDINLISVDVNNNFEMKCQLKFTVDPNLYINQVHNKYFCQLLSDIKNLVDENLFYDATLRSIMSPWKEKVHKCLAVARLKKLKNESFHFSHTYLSLTALALAKLREFIYPVNLLKMSSLVKTELICFAETYNIPWLHRKLQRDPYKFLFISELVADCIQFDYDLEPIKLWTFSPHSRVYNLPNIQTFDLMISFEISRSDDGEKFLQISLELSHTGQNPADAQRPVSFVLDMVLLDNNGDIIEPRPQAIAFMFDERNVFHPEPLVTEDVLNNHQPEPCTLQIKLWLHKVFHKTKKDRCCYAINISPVYLNDIAGFSEDLLELYHYPLFHDVVLECGSHRCHLHSIILWARSSFFRELIGQRVQNNLNLTEIRIDDAHSYYILVVLKYIYSGQLLPDSPNQVRRLLTVVDFFKQPLLREICEEYLEQIEPEHH